MSRRQFLRTSGGLYLVVAGGALAGPLGCGAGDGADDEPDGSLASGVVLCDPALCAGCLRCALTCSALHDGGGVGIADARLGTATGSVADQLAGVRGAVETCRQCPAVTAADGQLVSPACVAACPHGAARIAPLGDPVYGDSRVRIIDPERCVGCGSCVAACPYHHPLLTAAGARKCDLCLGLEDAPACVAACPASALSYHEPWTDSVPRPFPWEDAG